jgi:arylsulfatase A-like enzyme
VAGAPTYFSFPAIMASRWPLALGRDVLGIAPQEPTIATSLMKAGYSTAAFIAANPYLGASFGYQQGFSTFRDFLAAELPEHQQPSAAGHLTGFNNLLSRASRQNASTAAMYDDLYFRYCQWRSARRSLSMDQLRRYPAADVLVDQARSWLSTVRGQPFFLWLHLMDPHHPYYPPDKALSELDCAQLDSHRARFLNSFWARGDISAEKLSRYKAEILSLYDAGIYWVDKQISRLVTALQHLRCWDDTVFSVTGDHGEEFLENGARYHTPRSLPDRLIHVPLLIRVPGRRGVRLPELPFGLIDLPPTLLDILGVEAPNSFQGRSGWRQVAEGKLREEPVIVECGQGCSNPLRMEDRLGARLLAVRDSTHKLTLDFTGKSEDLFHLRSDPDEKTPLRPSAGQRERVRLLQRVYEHLQRMRTGLDHDLRLRARLRELQQLANVSSNDEAEVKRDLALAI